MNNIIDIELNNKSDYKNTFNNNRISKELKNYILNEIKSTNLKDKVTLEIDSKIKLTKEEQKDLVSMLKLSFKDDLDELKLYQKIEMMKSSILMLLGVITLIIYYLSNNTFFISEFILIIGWIFIWESANIFLFSRTENKIKQQRSKQLIKANIIFK